jgi:transposase
MLAKIRRMYFRDKVPLREIARQTGLSRNTLRQWLRKNEMREPCYPARKATSLLDPYKEQLVSWLTTDSHRPKRDRRTAKVLFQLLQAQGYPGGYARVAIFAKQWREAGGATPNRRAFIPLRFAPGEAFQFDWSCEYAVIAGIKRRLDVAHIKLAHSRVFLLVAYPLQTHEMLFDAHAHAFAAFGGVPRRGIFDNMKTAVDKVGRGKERTVNARFQAMVGHYLFEAEFCNRAAGWEKGIVEKNVQDRRRQLWAHANGRHWASLQDLNEWLASECRSAWHEMRHPECPDLTLHSVLEDEQPYLMPNPQPFDGYIEHPVRVSATALIHYQRSRYSVPAELEHQVISLRVYPWELVLVAEGDEVARHPRCFDRYQTMYDWQHYVGVLQRKPGALRNGAPFSEMPDPLNRLQRHLLRHDGGDRVMAQVLAAVISAGLEPVLVAVELVLASGNVSGEHVLNVLARLQTPTTCPAPVLTGLTLTEEPRADVERYDHLRGSAPGELSHVE